MKHVALMLIAAVSACSSNASNWVPADTKDVTDAVQLGAACESYCLGDGGCESKQAADCFHSMDCNLGSALHRHGAPDLLDGGAGCKARP